MKRNGVVSLAFLPDWSSSFSSLGRAPATLAYTTWHWVRNPSGGIFFFFSSMKAKEDLCTLPRADSGFTTDPAQRVMPHLWSCRVLCRALVMLIFKLIYSCTAGDCVECWVSSVWRESVWTPRKLKALPASVCLPPSQKCYLPWLKDVPSTAAGTTSTRIQGGERGS